MPLFTMVQPPQAVYLGQNHLCPDSTARQSGLLWGTGGCGLVSALGGTTNNRGDADFTVQLYEAQNNGNKTTYKTTNNKYYY